MTQLIFILGGARSGKSAFAQWYAEQLGGDSVLFVATAEARDSEMAERIQRHRASRPKAWRTVEEPLHIAQVIQSQWLGQRVVLVDCLTLWVSNWLLSRAWATSQEFEAYILHQCEELLYALHARSCHGIFVSNEVGLGLVPADTLSRWYRDALGLINQRVAAKAHQVIWMQAGIPVQIKPALKTLTWPGSFRSDPTHTPNRRCGPSETAS